MQLSRLFSLRRLRPRRQVLTLASCRFVLQNPRDWAALFAEPVSPTSFRRRHLVCWYLLWHPIGQLRPGYHALSRCVKHQWSMGGQHGTSPRASQSHTPTLAPASRGGDLAQQEHYRCGMIQHYHFLSSTISILVQTASFLVPRWCMLLSCCSGRV